MIGIQDGVVIRIDQRLTATALNGIGVTGRQKLTERCWIALIVRRPMATRLMQDNHSIFDWCSGQKVGNGIIQNTIEAFFTITPLGLLGGQRRNVLHPITRAFATRIVVNPRDCIARALQHIKQAFTVLGQIRVVIFAGHTRKHTRHRDGGCRSTGGGLAKVNHLTLGQLRCSVMR